MLLYEAAGVVAVGKPAGLATQAPPGLPSVESWLRGRLPHGAYVGVPHRLDRAVSGVLLMAVTPRAARTLSRQFERRQIVKRYVAILAGGIADAVVGEAHEWRDFMVKVAHEPRARIASAAEEGAREAVTRARVAARIGDDRMVVLLEPLTGRMHQLRVQAAARGAPIAGDCLYGSHLPFGAASAAAAQARLRPIALHALRIEYTDPSTGDRVGVAAPLPRWWPPEAVAAAGS